MELLWLVVVCVDLLGLGPFQHVYLGVLMMIS